MEWEEKQIVARLREELDRRGEPHDHLSDEAVLESHRLNRERAIRFVSEMVGDITAAREAMGELGETLQKVGQAAADAMQDLVVALQIEYLVNPAFRRQWDELNAEEGEE